MAEGPAYGPTTTQMDGIEKSSRFGHLGIPGFSIKLVEVVLSCIAFVLEEVVTTCNACSKLYFFEFVSCTAFLFTLLLLILLASSLHKKVGIAHWDRLDLGYTGVIAILFLIASIVFSLDNSGSSVESMAGTFGILASVVFFANVAYLLMKRRQDICGTPTNNMPTTQQPTQPSSPESEKLTNGQDNV